MDVFRATTDYIPPQGCRGVIPLMEGDFFEVLESEQYRYHKDWWGVRRTGDNAIGYVPARYIKVSACCTCIFVECSARTQIDLTMSVCGCVC